MESETFHLLVVMLNRHLMFLVKFHMGIWTLIVEAGLKIILNYLIIFYFWSFDIMEYILRARN